MSGEDSQIEQSEGVVEHETETTDAKRLLHLQYLQGAAMTAMTDIMTHCSRDREGVNNDSLLRLGENIGTKTNSYIFETRQGRMRAENYPGTDNIQVIDGRLTDTMVVSRFLDIFHLVRKDSPHIKIDRDGITLRAWRIPGSNVLGSDQDIPVYLVVEQADEETSPGQKQTGLSFCGQKFIPLSESRMEKGEGGDYVNKGKTLEDLMKEQQSTEQAPSA